MKGLTAAYLPDNLTRQKNFEAKPESLDSLREYLQRTGKAYRTFKWREERDGYYTRFQKERRKKDFLQNHAGVIGEFCRLLGGLSPEEQRAALTLPETREMKEDFIRFFPDSSGAAVFSEKKEKRSPEKEKAADKALEREPEPGRYAPRRKAESGKRYSGTSLFVHPENEAFRGEDEGLTREKEAAQADREEALMQGLSDLQLKGIRENCAVLYRNAMQDIAGLRSDRAQFLDTIRGKTPRELLLTFYCIEKGNYGVPGRREIRQALRSYVPDPEVIMSRMTRSRWSSAAAGITGNYYFWNRLINASNSVRQVRTFLMETDPAAPDEEDSFFQEEERQDQEGNTGGKITDDIRRWLMMDGGGEAAPGGGDTEPEADAFGDSGMEDSWTELPFADLFRLL